ncbi:putative ribonuclease H-like domain-containing protein [Tanacetum coccineum]
MKKMYCLVVTDDYSRFSWVFFLATKDETSEILKTFITGIENLIDLKVKVIRCDNGTEFKNKVMNQFYEMKGKFDGKADEGFFVGYSTNSKAYKVFNNRTRIVEENLHVKFSEETPNIAGNGPNWLFDIDALTISMNYKPVMAGNQTNGNACTKENIDACQDGKKIDSPDAGFKPSGEEEKINYEHQENEDSEVPNTEEPRVNQEQDANVNNTNNINTVSPTVSAADIENNVVDENIVYGCIDDPNMPNLEEIVYSDKDEEVGAEADMNNLSTTVPVNPSWIEAMQDELLQFKLQKVWTLVDLPYGKRAIGTKWVYRNKKDDRGIVVRNKARLVAQRTQKPRKAKKTTEISQSSRPIHLVADETIYKEWKDRMERAATTASSLEAEQDSGNINRTQSMATLNESLP